MSSDNAAELNHEFSVDGVSFRIGEGGLTFP